MSLSKMDVSNQTDAFLGRMFFGCFLLTETCHKRIAYKGVGIVV